MSKIFIVFLGLCIFDLGSVLGVQVSPAPLGLWVWSAEQEESHFHLEINQSEEGWHALVQTRAANIEVKDTIIRVGGPSGQYFTGRMSDDRTQILGHWYQPLSDLGYQEMITPVALLQSNDDVWEAEFQVQERPFTVFLHLYKDTEDQTIKAAIRNPERNETDGFMQYILEPNGNRKWQLSASYGRYTAEIALEEIDATSLSLEHSRFEKTLKLRPANERDQRIYFSRPSTDRARGYTAPPSLEDGWTVANASTAGFDVSLLDQLVKKIATENPSSNRPNLVHSMLVAHRGTLVFEEYFHGHSRETRHDVRSLAKVFGPVLLGAMRYQGMSISADDRPIPSLYEAAGKVLDDPKKANITLAHLMSFTSGLACDDTSANSPGSEDKMWAQTDETDFWLYTAQLPSIYAPGERYAYCSGSINLVGASLRAAAGRPILDSFHSLIAKPLQFGAYHWDLAPNGAAYLGGGVYMRPRDILKIGAIHASQGLWNGERILSENWVHESTSAKIEITPQTTRLSVEDFNNNYFGGAHAYIWRVDTVKAGERTYTSYEATGNGGQIVLVVPELDLTAVFTGGNYFMGYIWGKWRDELVGSYIIPALPNG